MAYFHHSDRETPAVMVRLHARLAERWPVTVLRFDDRFDHWEHNELGILPLETVASFTVRLGQFVSVSASASCAWPEGAIERVEIKVWLTATRPVEWFAVVDGHARRLLEEAGFEDFAQWFSVWKADDSCVEGIASQVTKLLAVPMRIIRQSDVPGEVRWPTAMRGALIAAADRIETKELEPGTYEGVLYTGQRESRFSTDEGGMGFIRWWEAVDRAHVGVPAYGKEGADETEAIAFEQGHAHAPDSRWGLQEIRLSRRGELRYARTQLGIATEVRGTVDPYRVAALFDAVSRTRFPEPPQRSFPPGATVCRISIESIVRPGSVDVEFHTGLRLPGYGDVLRALNDLNTALRESNAHELKTWRFVREGPENR